MKKKRWHIHFVTDPIYKFNVNVVVGMTYAEFIDYANKCTGGTVEVTTREKKTVNACFYHDDDKGWFFIWVPFRVKKDSIAHEIVHLIMRMFHIKDVPIAIQNEETFAYHLQWWFKEVETCIRKSKN